MDKMEEKFKKFSYMIMKEADAKKKELVSQADDIRAKSLSEKEISFLKAAYERIHEALAKIEKEYNEEVSKAILSGKQTLFNRREEILKSVFSNVKSKLVEFKQSEAYKSFMIETIMQGITKAGQGEIQLYVDSDDINLVEEIRAKTGTLFEVLESEEQLMGGCLVRNKTKGFMFDFSFTKSLGDEKAAFLENYGLSID